MSEIWYISLFKVVIELIKSIFQTHDQQEDSAPTLYQTYLPMIYSSAMRIGIDCSFCKDEAGAIELSDVGVKTSSLIGPYWKIYEPSPGVYNEEAFTDVDIGVNAMTKYGIDLMMVIFGAPDWANNGNMRIGISPEYFSNYAAFLQTIVTRYPQVKYFQIWNEPDTYGIGTDNYWGLWEDPVTYAQMLTTVRPAIREVRPDVSIIIGLCGTSRHWMSIILENGAGEAIDSVAFHYYKLFGDTAAHIISEYVGDIRDTFEEFDCPKPVWITEANLLTDLEATEEFEQAKALFWRTVPDIARDNNVRVLLGYTWRGSWRNCMIRDTLAEDVFREIL